MLPGMTRFFALALAGLLALPALPARAAGPPPTTCPPDPPGLLVPDETLAALAAELHPGRTVKILAVGSASTVAAEGYPLAMLAALQESWPGVTFHLTRVGGRGQDAAETLHMLTKSLRSAHYTLVLWQTGTVDAVRGLPPDDLADMLNTGAALVREHGADLVLIDPQFSRFLRANVDLEPYETALRMAATEPAVVLFPRHELMRSWVEDAGIDPERASEADAEATATLLRHCMGEALARFLLAGVAK
jgi:hypothetical protein